MKSTSLLLASLLALLAAPACGGDGAGNGADAAGDGDGDGDGDANTATWTTLISRDWDMSAGTEGYRCVTKTVSEDTYITAFRTRNPTGEHHTVLTIQDPQDPDGAFNCQVGTLSDQMLFASGVGTSSYAFPPGVAIKVPAGKQMLLNLHLYTTDTALADTSAIEVQTVPASQVEQEAEFIFGGTFNVYVPAGQTTTLDGACTFTQDATVVALWPHQHQLGIHHRVSLEPQGGDPVDLLDIDFSFDEQSFHELTSPVLVHANDKLRTYCTWQNNTGSPVYIGDSSDAEMCFTGIYRYPKFGTDLFCAEGFNPF